MKYSNTPVLWLLLAGTGFLGCKGLGKSFAPSIAGYDATRKQTLVLKKELREISGISYLPGGQLAAINDEEGKIFLVNTSTGTFESSHFGKKGDYEDVVMANGFYYVLESNGTIHQVAEGTKEEETAYEFPHVKKRIEFESLYYEEAGNRLVLITKEQREVKNVILAYTFDLLTHRFAPDPAFSISLEEIHIKMQNSVAEFKPSAATINPILNKLFIIASVGKCMVQCSLDGKVEKLYLLNPDQFPQPEGITFAPNGDMYISNEGENSKATILKFPYHK